MNLATEVFGKVVIVHAPEELGEEQAKAFVDCVTSLERSNVVLDLDHTEMLDSRGLEALLQSSRDLREASGNLKISTTNAVNRKILEITRLDEHLEVFESVIDGVKSFQQ
jgi:anti-sigma B factor antagonist